MIAALEEDGSHARVARELGLTLHQVRVGRERIAVELGFSLHRPTWGSFEEGNFVPDAAAAALSADDIQITEHETLDRIATGTVTAVPFIGLGLVVWQTWASALRWSDFAVFAIMYLVTGLGITVGFHRLLTHRSFKTKPWLRGTFAALGSIAIEGPVISWVADHRKHHAFSDQEGDPHSPHVDHGGGFRGALRGLLHAHVGWLFIHTQRANKERYAPDLMKDPQVALRRAHVPVVGARRAGRVPFLLGLPDRRQRARGTDRPPVGRARPHAAAAPRDLQHQLAVPLLRPAPVRHRRRVAQPRLARPAVARRGVAQQPPRLPHLGGARACGAGRSTPRPRVIWLLEKTGLAWDVVRVPRERRRRASCDPPRR